MSGERRLSPEGIRKLSFRPSDLNFGVIAFVLLTAAAIIVAWKFPDLQLAFVAGP
jgi:hypothetical protein